MEELFTVISFCYNNSQYLTCNLESVFAQDYDNIELIVVDDHSITFDLHFIESYIQKHMHHNIRKFTVYQNPENYGTVKSLNRALKQSTGKYIKLLAADDALYDEYVLSRAAESLQNNPCGFIVSNVMKCDSDLKQIGLYKKKLQTKINNLTPEKCFAELCIRNDIVAGGVFFSRLFFNKYGLFDEEYRLLEDWPTWLKVTQLGGKPTYEQFYSLKYRANCGIGASVNHYYLDDRKKVYRNIIFPSRSRIGYRYYHLARLSSYFTTSVFVRKIYATLFRK